MNRVVKVTSGLFTVDTDEGRVVCRSRSKNKREAICVGDFVEINDGVIERVLPRKNRLIRPALANVDRIIIVVAPLPKPDFYLLDKLIVNCFAQKVEAVICVNKSDLKDDVGEAKIREEYAAAVPVIAASALEGDVSQIIPYIDGGLACLAGQSAVGKSTITNALIGGARQETGEMSRKTERGKNTTTVTELFPVAGGYLADTPGFGLLDLHGVKAEELDLYYPEFESYISECKLHRCSHAGEPDCAVRAAAENGSIPRGRYDRYLSLREDSAKIKSYDKKRN